LSRIRGDLLTSLVLQGVRAALAAGPGVARRGPQNVEFQGLDAFTQT